MARHNQQLLYIAAVTLLRLQSNYALQRTRGRQVLHRRVERAIEMKYLRCAVFLPHIAERGR
jgi:hypothetical protein